MIKETSTFVLPTGEKCELNITELNHKVFALQPVITLNNPVLPHTAFQHISQYLISNNKNYNKIYFESMKFKYRFLSFNLFGHIRAAFKKELKRHVLMTDLISNKETYDWIIPDFLPKFPNDIDEILTLNEKHVNCLYLASKKGVINDIHYQLTDPKIDYNYVYDLHPTDLIPIFDLYISTKIYFQHPPQSYKSTYDEQQVINILKEKYYKLGVSLKVI